MQTCVASCQQLISLGMNDVVTPLSPNACPYETIKTTKLAIDIEGVRSVCSTVKKPMEDYGGRLPNTRNTRHVLHHSTGQTEEPIENLDTLPHSAVVASHTWLSDSAGTQY